VNGHNVPQKVVANLFQSVQLNVNNPHFLIMQGRITKVLNMKPPEILAMIEEASGTRMFEDKKESAISTISKKEKKLEEIHTVRPRPLTSFIAAPSDPSLVWLVLAAQGRSHPQGREVPQGEDPIPRVPEDRS